MQPFHFRPTEDRAVTIDDQITSAHGRVALFRGGGRGCGLLWFGAWRFPAHGFLFGFPTVEISFVTFALGASAELLAHAHL